MTSRRSMIALLCAATLAFSAAPRLSYAQDDHLSQAISHTREAVAAGRENKPNSLVIHATEALAHATEAQKEQPSPNLQKAITRLKETIKFGKKKRKAATTIAERALQELERTPQ
jgi:hypothetical protein